MLASLLKPATEEEILEYRELQQQSREDCARNCERHPEHALQIQQADLFNFTYHAVHTRNEKMLDDLWQEQEELAPDNKLFNNQIKYCRAQLRIHEQKFGEAIEMLQAVIKEEHCANRSHALLYLIELYAREEDYKSAAKYVHAYLENSDREYGREKAWADLSSIPYFLEVLGLADEYENVIAIGKERLALRNDEFQVWYVVGLSYLRLGDELRAMHYFTEALKLQPKLPEVYMQLAEFYWNTKDDFNKAIDYSKQALELCGKELQFKNFRAMIYRNMANLYRLAHKLDLAGEYRRKQFAAMGTLALFDLLAFFGDDEQSLNEFRIWAENHPEVYEKFLKGEANEDDFYRDEDLDEDDFS